ncbi:retrovirus-related pol polyprotein from transposon tnt 1-94, partial [Trifolium medium]|nr:retrovirus-related pol polyprotein from transposon tnt 1-94 [Trifolium medium]
KLWVYASKTKDQVLEKFKEFHALVDRQTCKKLKCVRSYNGDEYCGPLMSIASNRVLHMKRLILKLRS